MNEAPSLESNLWKLTVIQAVRWFLLIMPVVFLFFGTVFLYFLHRNDVL